MNKNKIAVISDGACDLTNDELNSFMKLVPFYIINDTSGKEENITTDELYDKMLNDTTLRYKTSCPSSIDFSNTFESFVKDGYSVICICISSKFSGSFSSACLGRENALKTYPKAKISVVDSAFNSALQGMLVLSVKEMAENNFKHDEILQKIKEIYPYGKIMFTVADVDYLRKGGRIGYVKAFVANTLHLKPIINIKEGELHLGGIGLGVRKTIQKIVEQCKKYFAQSTESKEDYYFSVGYSSNTEDGEKLVEICSDMLNINKKFFRLTRIGSTTAVHTGPNTIGVSFIKKWSTI